MLFSSEEIKSDFENYEILELEEKIIHLNEGLLHNGQGSVIRFVGRKKINFLWQQIDFMLIRKDLIVSLP